MRCGKTVIQYYTQTCPCWRWPSYGAEVLWREKALLTGFSALTVVTLRFCGAAFLTGILFFRIIRKSDCRVIRHGLILGVVQFAAQGIQLMGLNYTTAGKQAFLIAGYVVLVPFLLWVVMKKRPALSSFAAGMIALAGIGLLSLDEGLTMGIGEILSRFPRWLLPCAGADWLFCRGG